MERGNKMNKEYFYGLVPVNIDIEHDKRLQILSDYPAPDVNINDAVFCLDDEVHGNPLRNVLVIVNDFKVEKASNGNSFLKISFENNRGKISAKMWDNEGAVDFSVPLLEEYSVFEISGKVEEYKGFKSVTVSRLQPYKKNDLNPFHLLPCSEQNIEDLITELYTYIEQLEKPYREITIKAMKTFWKEFSIRPAAKGYHHNYLTGLLKHTVGLMRLAKYIVVDQPDPYQAIIRLIQTVEKAHKKELWDNLQSENPVHSRKLTWNETTDHIYSIFYHLIEFKEHRPNYSEIICSIFFHDLGKIIEYQHAGKGLDEFGYLFPTAELSSLEKRKPTGITMDDLGSLVGHIPLGMMLFNKLIEKENITIPIQDVFGVLHNISCHHGKLEWGSSTKPQTFEGHLIHLCDYLDSRYEQSEDIK
jgi:3'-5' exoribonuclease